MDDEELFEAWMERGQFQLDNWKAVNPNYPFAAQENDAFYHAWELAFRDRDMGWVK